MADPTLLADVRAFLRGVAAGYNAALQAPDESNDTSLLRDRGFLERFLATQSDARIVADVRACLARLDAAPDRTPLVRALVAETRAMHVWHGGDEATCTGASCVAARALVAAWPEVGG